MKTALKYIAITIIGVSLFFLARGAALPERTNGSIGGEGCFLFLPLLWFITERTVKDLIGEFKRLWREIKPDSGNTPQDKK